MHNPFAFTYGEYFFGNKDSGYANHLPIYPQLHSLPSPNLTHPGGSYVSQAPVPFSLKRGLAHGRYQPKIGEHIHTHTHRKDSISPLSALGSFSGSSGVFSGSCSYSAPSLGSYLLPCCPVSSLQVGSGSHFLLWLISELPVHPSLTPHLFCYLPCNQFSVSYVL